MVRPGFRNRSAAARHGRCRQISTARSKYGDPGAHGRRLARLARRRLAGGGGLGERPRGAARGGGARASSTTMSGSPPCSRPGRPCRWWSPPTATISGPDRLAGALGLDGAAAALARFVRRGGAVPDRGGGRARPDGERGGVGRAARHSSSGRPGSARIFRIDGGPAPAGFAERSALLWFLDVTAAEEDAARLAGQLRAPLGGARRAVRPDRGGALPDVASRPRPQAGHGQRRLCRRGRRARTRPPWSRRASS